MSVTNRIMYKFTNRNSKMINELKTIDNKGFNHFEKLNKFKKKVYNDDFNKKFLDELHNVSEILLNSSFFNEYQYSNIYILIKSLYHIFNNVKYSNLTYKFKKMYEIFDTYKEHSVSIIFKNIKSDVENMLIYIYKNYYNILPQNVLNEISLLKNKIKYITKNYTGEEDSLYEEDINMIKRILENIDENTNSDTNSDTDGDYDYNSFDNMDQDIKNNITNDLSFYDNNNDSDIDDYEEEDNISVEEDILPINKK
jgi:hypothetical protein